MHFDIDPAVFMDSWTIGLKEDQNNEIVHMNQQMQTDDMMIKKRKKEALKLGRQDLMPRELTRDQTLQAFDYEIELRM